MSVINDAEKTTIDYSPMPIGKIQPLNPRIANNVSQTNMDFNEKILHF